MPDRAGRAFRKEQALKPLYTMIGTAAIKGKVRCLGAPSPRRRDVLGMDEVRARRNGSGLAAERHLGRICETAWRNGPDPMRSKSTEWRT